MYPRLNERKTFLWNLHGVCIFTVNLHVDLHVVTVNLHVVTADLHVVTADLHVVTVDLHVDLHVTVTTQLVF